MGVRSFGGHFVTLGLSQMSIYNSPVFVKQFYGNTPLRSRRWNRQTRFHVLDNLERGAADWYRVDRWFLCDRRSWRLCFGCRLLRRARDGTRSFLAIAAGRDNRSATIRWWRRSRPP